MDFGRPNAEIGQKMANGQLLFLALHPSPPIENLGIESGLGEYLRDGSLTSGQT